MAEENTKGVAEPSERPAPFDTEPPTPQRRGRHLRAIQASHRRVQEQYAWLEHEHADVRRALDRLQEQYAWLEHEHADVRRALDDAQDEVAALHDHLSRSEADAEALNSQLGEYEGQTPQAVAHMVAEARALTERARQEAERIDAEAQARAAQDRQALVTELEETRKRFGIEAEAERNAILATAAAQAKGLLELVDPDGVRAEAAAMKASAEREASSLRATAEREITQLRAKASREAEEKRAEATKMLSDARDKRDKDLQALQLELAERREASEREETQRHAAAVAATRKLVGEAEQRARAAEERAKEIEQRAEARRVESERGAHGAVEKAKAPADKTVDEAREAHRMVSESWAESLRTTLGHREVERLLRQWGAVQLDELSPVPSPDFSVVLRGYERSAVDSYIHWARLSLVAGNRIGQEPSRDFSVQTRGYDRHQVDQFLASLDEVLRELP